MNQIQNKEPLSAEQGEILVQLQFDELMRVCEPVCKSADDLEKIRQAFYFARDAHKGVKRKSGEPYITHPLAVARIVVVEIGLGVKSVIASLLHDVVEDTEYTVDDIEHLFGAKVASMVDGLTKLGGVFETDISQQAENFKKMLMTLSDDIRVIIIKIADRLHNMRTLGSMAPHKQMKIAGETIYLFAPLAHRLGLYAIKSELENLSLMYRFPDEYNEIQAKLRITSGQREQFIENFIAPIRAKLSEYQIECEISGRVKSVYSIWKKMKSKQITFDEIYDLFAIRIIFKSTKLVPEKSQCWHIYSLVTDIYKPKTERIRDWVNTPKANGYEALHGTVMGPVGMWAEVQIRSERMNEIAERGFAAHLKYKTSDIPKDQMDVTLDPWLAQLREALNNPAEDAVEFLDNFKLNLQVSDIVVFTPKGDSRTMPRGATVLDFAYSIHSKVGNSAIGAKINYKLSPLSTEIQSGDQIEIITSPTVRPKIEWLDMVITAKAKSHIKQVLKRENENNIQRGRELFEVEMKRQGITIQARVFHKILPAYNCMTKDQFYSKLGAGVIKIEDVDRVMKHNSSSKLMKYWSLKAINPFKKSTPAPKVEESQDFVIADCCNPIPGDEVVGFKMDDTVVEIHKKSCPEAVKLSSQHGERIVPAKWSSEKIMSYLAVIDIKGIDRVGILLDLSKIISGELSVNIREVEFHSHDGIFDGKISLYVRNNDDLKMIMAKVGQVKGIDKITRIETKTID